MIWQILGGIGLFVVIGLIGGFLIDDDSSMNWWQKIAATWLWLIFGAVVIGAFVGILYGLTMLATGQWVPL